MFHQGLACPQTQLWTSLPLDTETLEGLWRPPTEQQGACQSGPSERKEVLSVFPGFLPHFLNTLVPQWKFPLRKYDSSHTVSFK